VADDNNIRPNILLITGDHVGWQTLAGRSRGQMPNLDRLARQGLSFDRSYTPVAVCCPARAMLVTGSYPWHNGIHNQVHVVQSLNRDLRSDVVTYAQRLREAGYSTAYFGKWHASHERGPQDLGYEVFGAVKNQNPPYLRRQPVPEAEVHRAPRPKLSGVQTVTWPGSEPFEMWSCDEGDPADTYGHFIAERASAALTRLAADRDADGRPWLLEAHFLDPHDPYRPLREFLDRYPADTVDLPRSYHLETFAGKPGMHAREAGLWAELGEQEFREGRRHYLAYCEQLDHQVGRILDALEETGQAESTLVVFGADHGDLVGAHRMFLKGWMPYEEAHRIPMVARWPERIRPGGTASALVQLHDWAHTFVELAGARPLPHAGGTSLVPLLSDPYTPGRDAILNVYYGAEFLYTQRIAIGQRFKYVFNGFDGDELYDLERDPDELHNLIDHPAYAADRDQMRTQLWDLMRGLGDPYVHGDRYGAARYLPRP